METIKVKFKKVIQPAVAEVIADSETELVVPFYSKSKEGIYFMIRQDGSLLRICSYDTSPEQNLTWYGRSNFWTETAINGIIISREEFMAEYNKAMSKIAIPEAEEAALSQDIK